MNASRLRIQGVVNHRPLSPFSLLMLYPVIWWVGASLKKNGGNAAAHDLARDADVGELYERLDVFGRIFV